MKPGICIALAGLLLLASRAHAGDRELEVLFANMTPDAASSSASKKCVADIEKVIEADYSRVVRIGETKLRQATKQTAGEPMFSWPVAALVAVKRRQNTYVDTLVMVDCRPEQRLLDVVVVPPSGGIVRMRLRHVGLTRETPAWIGQAILRRAWIRFSP